MWQPAAEQNRCLLVQSCGSPYWRWKCLKPANGLCHLQGRPPLLVLWNIPLQMLSGLCSQQ